MIMQQRNFWPLLLLGVIGSVGPAFAEQQDSREDPLLRFVPTGDVSIEISGTSTVNEWTCSSDAFEGVFEADITTEQLQRALMEVVRGTGDLAIDEEEASSNPLRSRIYVDIDPRELDCGNRRMERDLTRAVRADEFPSINFWFTGIAGEPELQENGSDREVKIPVEGILVLAGVPREVTHEVRMRVLNYDLFEFSGTIPLNMRDFDIDPPRALLGLIRAHEEITVSYQFQLQLDDQ